MASGKILSEKPMNVVEVKDLLKKIEKRDGELGYRSMRTQEYVDFVKLSKKDGKELYKKLEELEIPRLKDIHIHKLIDILPETVDELKVVLQGYTLSVNNDNLKAINKVIREYC